jgi:hypothetical protein
VAEEVDPVARGDYAVDLGEWAKGFGVVDDFLRLRSDLGLRK